MPGTLAGGALSLVGSIQRNPEKQLCLGVSQASVMNFQSFCGDECQFWRLESTIPTPLCA